METINTNKNWFTTVKDKNGLEKKITYVRGREIYHEKYIYLFLSSENTISKQEV